MLEAVSRVEALAGHAEVGPTVIKSIPIDVINDTLSFCETKDHPVHRDWSPARPMSGRSISNEFARMGLSVSSPARFFGVPSVAIDQVKVIIVDDGGLSIA